MRAVAGGALGAMMLAHMQKGIAAVFSLTMGRGLSEVSPIAAARCTDYKNSIDRDLYHMLGTVIDYYHHLYNDWSFYCHHWKLGQRT